MASFENPPERAFVLQKYLLLHDQQSSLQKHLEEVLPSPTSSPPTSCATSTSSVSSALNSTTNLALEHHDDVQIINPRQRPHSLRRLPSLPSHLPHANVDDMNVDEQKLNEVNQQIKSTLTDLLNCAGVRSDGRYRRWVQTRLMDVQRELKCHRRKGSFGGVSSH
ncbi:hypothetical protein BJ875DRAFT_290439 [Amylocarpus encephaloides]|uniref:Uncharacterized protein n=1 Tax=Amylocarpus encephaloides TaxID=45428 RepID=A0A9P7YKU2_9HELO|nr:hypothetical protein BJ875DRAFT_290439 [Amylocarpus encephaloides]